MTNEQFENLTKMVQSDNFDDILLAVEIMKEQFWGDISDPDFIVPKRYRRILETIHERCIIGWMREKSKYQNMLKLVYNPEFERCRNAFNMVNELKRKV